LEFGSADVHYLANLCHSCGACLHACQYAPPHEFAVNVPQAMAAVRGQTYQAYAWPRAMGVLYARNGLTVALALAFGLAFFLTLAMMRNGSLLHEPLAGNFYKIFPHGLMAGLFGGVSLFVVFAMLVGVTRFWREVGRPQGADALSLARLPEVKGPALAEATHDALRLRYLEDCNNEDDAVTPWRRIMHHFTFYGFMLCFASTSVGTIYHYVFGWPAPYALTSLPVVLGTVGGVGLLIGTCGFLWLRTKRHVLHRSADQKGMDIGFISLLALTSFTGLELLAVRDTRWMGLSLAIHLGIVMALFLTLPYGKFMHGVYRVAALLKYSIEKRLPSHLKLGGD
jgi:citrate/tricarballylate utilization protein